MKGDVQVIAFLNKALINELRRLTNIFYMRGC